MSRDTRQSSYLAEAARVIKQLDGRLSDLEQSARNRDDPVHRIQNVEASVEIDVAQVTLTAFRSGEIRHDHPNWDSYSRTEKYYALLATDSSTEPVYDPVTERTLAAVTPTFAMRDWTAAHLQSGARHDPATALAVGTGELTLEPSARQLTTQIGSVSIADGNVSTGSDAAQTPQANLYTVLDDTEFSGQTIRELGVSTARRDDSLLNVSVEPAYEKASNRIVIITLHPYWDDGGGPTRFLNGGKRLLARRLVGHQMPPPTHGVLSIGESHFDPAADSLDIEVGRIPITDWSARDGTVFLTAFLDSARFNNQLLTEFGLVAFRETADERVLLTAGPLSPPIEKNPLSSWTIETQFDVTIA